MRSLETDHCERPDRQFAVDQRMPASVRVLRAGLFEDCALLGQKVLNAGVVPVFDSVTKQRSNTVESCEGVWIPKFGEALQRIGFLLLHVLHLCCLPVRSSVGVGEEEILEVGHLVGKSCDGCVTLR
jgi:hypothetical protein